MGPRERFGWAAGLGGGRGVTRLSPAPRWQLITEQADIPLSRGAEMKGKCGTNESELEISWLERAYTLKLFFLKVRDCPRRCGRCAAALRGPDQPCPRRRGTTRPAGRRLSGGSAGSSSPMTPRSAPTSRMPSAVSAQSTALQSASGDR